MFKPVKNFLGGLLAATIGLATGTEPAKSESEQLMPSDVYAVKNKLGRSFFTRRLNPNTRWRRINSLTPKERAIAEHMRWI